MPDIQYSPRGARPPLCPSCVQEMALDRVARDEEHYPLQIFACRTCQVWHTRREPDCG